VRDAWRALISHHTRAPHPQEKTSKYAERIGSMMAARETRLLIHLGDLRERASDLARGVLQSPLEHVPALEAAVKEAVLNLSPGYFDELGPARPSSGGKDDALNKIHVGFEGNFGAHGVTPRSLGSQHISQLVAVEGIVTKCTTVRPKVVRSVHYCPATEKHSERSYRDATDLTGLPTGSVYPSRDDAGNLLETEFGMCIYKDTQSFHIQEMPESAPLGQLPRSVEVYVEHDLCDSVKPGDRVAMIGIYRATSGRGEWRTRARAGCRVCDPARVLLLASLVPRPACHSWRCPPVRLSARGRAVALTLSKRAHSNPVRFCGTYRNRARSPVRRPG